MGIRSTVVAGIGGLVLAAVAVIPLASANGQRESVGLWPTGYQAQQTASDCGKWALDANNFCVADDARNGLEVGVKFRTARSLEITGLRIYRADSAELRGSLWDSDGNRLRSGLFPPQSGNGWQDMRFDQPVAIQPGRTYVASYFTPRTKYAFRYGFFADSSHTVGPITALQATDAEPNGVHCYDDAACVSFPVRAFRNSTYWVTPLWEAAAGDPSNPTVKPTATPTVKPTGPSTPKPTTKPTGGTSTADLRVVKMTPRAGAKRVRGKAKVRVTFSRAVRKSSLNRANVKLVRKGGARVAARLVYNAKRREVVIRPRSALRGRTTYRVVVTAGVRALAGDRLDQNPDEAGRQPATWHFRTR
ncbi:DUF4082 domain-containing protein [Nocardioides houyundeii]|uniref:DUF4082 domain-containing protein n=1 Tax=Nocardioides houyundeii TaxID=2045452 RepID=UPI000DF4AEE9|nr:DUF4082 domain-containing protein [Nocardioides houyundeii]